MTVIALFAALIIVLVAIRIAYNKSCLSNVDVRLSFSAKTATEGDELILKEEISNQKWLPLPWVEVKFQVDRELEFADNSAAVITDLYYRNDLFHILMHQKITRRLKFTCAKRGYYAIKGLEVAGWDILMEAKHIKKFDTALSLTVYPSRLELPETDALCTRIYGQLATPHPIHPDPFTFRGIREYSPHDPMKAINFKASAKTGELMANIYDFSNSRQIALLLDIERHIAWHNESAEERAIKITASLAEKMNAAGIPTAFYTNGKSIISGEPAYIPEGKGAVQIHSILETLAYIDTNAEDILPFAQTLQTIRAEGNITPEYWLISPYFSKATHDALIQLKQTGARTAWIMPGDKPNDFDVYSNGADVIFV